uniref:Ocellatin-2 n=1 Tax=Leptodactylus ocellatus TaxID=928525 RepID=OCE2_LEPOE|nr:RecName: Full=Ocellatin-2 [Leptodactylus bolivianus]
GVLDIFKDAAKQILAHAAEQI